LLNKGLIESFSQKKETSVPPEKGGTGIEKKRGARIEKKGTSPFKKKKLYARERDQDGFNTERGRGQKRGEKSTQKEKT